MITGVDWIIWTVYLCAIFTFLWFYRHTKKDAIYDYFIKGFIIKVIGSIAFSMVYVYYYKFGDSFEYYKGASMLSDALTNSPSDYIDLLFSESSTNFIAHLKHYTDPLAYSDTFEEWFMVKLISPLALISFKSYLTMNLFMGVISFWGGWKLFKVFADIIPKHKNIAFFAVFLIPSVIFWGGGIMKDTFTLTGVNYLVYALYFGVLKKHKNYTLLLGSILWFLIIFYLKSYIALALIPGIVLTLYFHYKLLVHNSITRYVITPLVFVFLFLVGFYSIDKLSTSSKKYSASQLEWKAKGFHSWHTDVGGSSYNLGEVEYTILGVIKKIPASLNVTFFRPYLWEVRTPVVLLGAIESTCLLILFIVVLFKTRLSFFKYIKDQPLLKGILIFVLIFGFAIGFISYNFGALARYKIPIFSLFIFILTYIYLKNKETTT